MTKVFVVSRNERQRTIIVNKGGTLRFIGTGFEATSSDAEMYGARIADAALSGNRNLLYKLLDHPKAAIEVARALQARELRKRN